MAPDLHYFSVAHKSLTVNLILKVDSLKAGHRFSASH